MSAGLWPEAPENRAGCLQGPSRAAQPAVDVRDESLDGGHLVGVLGGVAGGSWNPEWMMH